MAVLEWPTWVTALFAKTPPSNGGVPPRLDTSRRPVLDEVSTNESPAFQHWPLSPYNPDDDLAQRKGLWTYEKMRTDDQVKAALKLKKGSVLSTGWEIQAASDAPEDQDVKEFFEYVLTHFDPLYGSFDDCLEEILSAVDFGFSVTEILYTVYETGPWAGKVGLRTLKTRKPHTFYFAQDAHGNLFPDGVRQGQNKYPIEKFLLYSFQRQFGNWYGLSDLRAAYRPWWAKDNVLRWWLIFLERFGIPITLGKYTSGTRAEDVLALRTALENLQANTTITYPDRYTIDLKEASAQGAIIFERTIDKLDLAIARALLVPSMLGISPQPDIGAYAQARKHFDVFLLILDDIRRDLREDVIQNQLFARLLGINFADRDPPQFEFKPYTEMGTMQLFDAWLKAVSVAAVRPTAEDEDHIRVLTGFPERDTTAVPAVPEPPEPPEEEIPPENPPESSVGVKKTRSFFARYRTALAARKESSLPDFEILDGDPGYGACTKCGFVDETRGGACFGCFLLSGGEKLNLYEVEMLQDYLDENPQHPRQAAMRALLKKVTPRGAVYALSRPPTALERKVNFARVEETLTAVQDKTHAQVRKVLERSREVLAQEVARQGADLTPAYVRSLALKYKGDLVRVVQDFLRRGYVLGQREARDMLAKAVPTFQVRTDVGMPPEKALQFFEQKAFWITGVLRDRLTAEAQNILWNAMKTGESSTETIRKLQDLFVPYLGDPLELDPDKEEQVMPYRLNTILRTNATEAFTEGMKDAVEDQVTSGYVIGWQYSAILDERTTEVCRYLDTLLFRPDSDALAQLTPPNHFNCRALLIPITREEAPVLFATPGEIGKGLTLKATGFSQRDENGAYDFDPSQPRFPKRKDKGE